MVVYVLMREDQNEYGYVDTSIEGVFYDERAACNQERLERHNARQRGLIVEGDAATDGEWQVSWAIHEQSVR
jgi:hypothetical protein